MRSRRPGALATSCAKLARRHFVASALIVLVAIGASFLPPGLTRPASSLGSLSDEVTAVRPPRVTISSPSALAEVSGTIEVVGTASPQVEVLELRFAKRSWIEVPPAGSWDHDVVVDGAATGRQPLEARATDATGRRSRAFVVVIVR